MSRFRIAILILVLLLAAASLKVHVPRTLSIVDAAGRPVPAYVAYRYEGSTLNFVHPVTYDASVVALARTGAEGRVRFPFAVHAHLPFPMQTHTSRWVEMLYVPSLHNAHARFGPDGVSQPGTFAFEPRNQRVVVMDASDRPDLWQGTLGQLSSIIQRVVPKPFSPTARLRDRDPLTADLALELISQFRKEYDGFLARHGEAARPMPRMPPALNDEEKRRWEAMVAADLAAEPTWGAQTTRLFKYYSTLFQEYETELR